MKHEFRDYAALKFDLSAFNMYQIHFFFSVVKMQDIKTLNALKWRE